MSAFYKQIAKAIKGGYMQDKQAGRVLKMLKTIIYTSNLSKNDFAILKMTLYDFIKLIDEKLQKQ